MNGYFWLSRVDRSIKQLIETVQLLAEKGIELKSLNESLDTGTATGKLLFHIVAAFAQFERDNMIENTKAGLEAARSRGKKGGRRRVMDDKESDRSCPSRGSGAAYRRNL